MLTDEQKEKIVKEVLPVFIGWTISDATDALQFAKGYLFNSMPVTKIPDQPVQEETGKE